ncbi:MAG TPA: RNA 2',3'-cyclic phosphodiesterase [Actinomycetota bacterium]|jgi:2'-5' RNA ligase|nr:RNA 2',3'-cyclic phosphodiesterase [Actinomycetota bacterium]
MGRDRASRPEAKPLRLFVAVDVPAEVRAAVAEAVAPIREGHPRARWVPLENQHVTVKFLGRTWPRLTDWVPERVREVAAEVAPFTTRVAGVGAFPSPRRARVLWAGLEDPDGRLAVMAGALDRAMSAEFEPEKRAFTPHLTVARFQPPVAVEEIGAGAEMGEPFPVDRLILYRSHLRRPAPVYEALRVFPLAG